MKHLNVEGTLR